MKVFIRSLVSGKKLVQKFDEITKKETILLGSRHPSLGKPSHCRHHRRFAPTKLNWPQKNRICLKFLKKNTFSFRSEATRSATETAASLLGSVQTIRTGIRFSDAYSRMYCGTWVVFPDPVSPVTITTYDQRCEAFKPEFFTFDANKIKLGILTMLSDRYFALRTKIHGAQCCGTTPQKLEMIRSFPPLFWSDKSKELLLHSMIREVLHHA